MVDAMLVVHRCAAWKGAKLFACPTHHLEPVVWVDDAQSLCFWHPVLPQITRSSRRADWDEVSFKSASQRMRQEVAKLIEGVIEERGLPSGYYSNYPEIVREVRQGKVSFTTPATPEDDAQADFSKAEGRRLGADIADAYVKD